MIGSPVVAAGFPSRVIRVIGTYKVVARLHTEVEVALTVVVEEEKA